MKRRNVSKNLLIIFAALIVLVFILQIKKIPETIIYGVSFSKFHSDELGLNFREVYQAILYDLGVRRLRLSAHWPMVEPREGAYNFEELDFQMKEARDAGASVILALGRRLPGWPECHEPDWTQTLEKSEKQKALLSLIKVIVARYKEYPNLFYWQVENEPFLTIFAKEHCGVLDREFLKEEIALVRALDPAHKILVTDSGELGTWFSAKNAGDVFGTSLYLYVWSPESGRIHYPITPAFFRTKDNITNLIAKKTESLLIELSLEPWLLTPIKDAPMETILDRMSIEKFDHIISFAKKAAFEEQYLWGVEWWYWMKGKGHPEYWEKAEQIFSPR